MELPGYRCNEIPAVLAKAFHIAKTGRPGPVLVDITKNAQLDKFDYKDTRNVVTYAATGQNRWCVKNI
jgi:thiamine pyrophosphate-dependent acetolactate synthase large subunit-like protein